MNGTRKVLALAPLALALACGGGGNASSHPDASAGGDAGNAVDAGDGLDAGPDAAGTGASCGGLAEIECEENLWCDFNRNSCGGDDSQGTCRQRPHSCTEEYQPVCGCDGEVYENGCMAQAAGTDVNEFGGCEAPAGYFECGYRFCPEDASYCQESFPGPPTLPSEYDCLGPPAECGQNPDCACLEGESCGQACQVDEDGNPTVTCAAP